MHCVRHKTVSGWLVLGMLAAALSGCGLADTAVSGAAGAASEAQEARQAQQTEQRVRDQIQSAQQQAADQRNRTERDSQ